MRSEWFIGIGATEAIPLRVRRGVEVSGHDSGDCHGLPPFRPSLHKNNCLSQKGGRPRSDGELYYY